MVLYPDEEFYEFDFATTNDNTVSIQYSKVIDDYHIYNLNTDYLETNCERVFAVWEDSLVPAFERHYAPREIGSVSEYDFFEMLQDCLDRNADTFERHLKVYDDDIANPILGRTETVTYNTTDTRRHTGTDTDTYDLTTTHDSDNDSTQHNIDVPANEDDDYEVDASRVKSELNEDEEDTQTGTVSHGRNTTDALTMGGSVTTELSDLGVRPNYESLNGFLINNKTYIQFFLEKFEECFAPRYQRIYI